MSNDHECQKTNVKWSGMSKNQCQMTTNVKKTVSNDHECQKNNVKWSRMSKNKCQIIINVKIFY